MKAILITAFFWLALAGEKHPPAPWIVDLVTLLLLFFVGRYVWRRIRRDRT